MARGNGSLAEAHAAIATERTKREEFEDFVRRELGGISAMMAKLVAASKHQGLVLKATGEAVDTLLEMAKLDEQREDEETHG